MGQAQSSSLDAASLEPGVKITQGLLLQLSGAETPQGSAISGAQASVTIKPTEEEEREAEAFAQEGAELAHALEHSRRVGHALLKADEAELKEINRLADELLAAESARKHRPRPCQTEAEGCVACYGESTADPLACAGAVAAYQQCTSSAWHGAVGAH